MELGCTPRVLGQFIIRKDGQLAFAIGLEAVSRTLPESAVLNLDLGWSIGYALDYQIPVPIVSASVFDGHMGQSVVRRPAHMVQNSLPIPPNRLNATEHDGCLLSTHG